MALMFVAIWRDAVHAAARYLSATVCFARLCDTSVMLMLLLC